MKTCERCERREGTLPFDGQRICANCWLSTLRARGRTRHRGARYQKLMAEAQAEYNAWETRYIAQLAATGNRRQRARAAHA